MIQAVAFDLDGTLLDTPSAIVETMASVLNEMGYSSSIDSQLLRSTIGLPLEQGFCTCMQLLPSDERVHQAVKRYRTIFNEQVVPQARTLLFPGVETGLVKLKVQGVRLAVATSKIYKSAYTLLEAADLVQFFDLIIGSDQVTQPKPHPAMLEHILAHLELTPTVTAMVGDTTHDIAMAQSAGLVSIAVTYGVHTPTTLRNIAPTYVANTFEEVVTYCLFAEPLVAYS